MNRLPKNDAGQGRGFGTERFALRACSFGHREPPARKLCFGCTSPHLSGKIASSEGKSRFLPVPVWEKPARVDRY